VLLGFRKILSFGVNVYSQRKQEFWVFFSDLVLVVRDEGGVYEVRVCKRQTRESLSRKKLVGHQKM
jgi:hypothetical protein